MGQVRIISGQWRRRRIPVPDRPGLRPTPDRVRETLFNWLEHLKEGSWASLTVLDLFAGTGALGFEAASRGAQRVTLVDRDRAACAEMLALAKELGAGLDQLRVVQADGLEFLQNGPECWVDLIFLDPPFGQDLLEPALVLAARAIRPGGMIYLESERPVEDWVSQPDGAPQLQSLVPIRSLRVGQVRVGLLSSQKSIIETRALGGADDDDSGISRNL